MRWSMTILVVGLLLSAACATMPSQLGYQYWDRPDGSEVDFAADQAACTSMSQGPASIVSSRGNVMRMEVNETAFLECMRGRGWELR